MNDLTEAMGIRSPSLYAAFGDKSNLFLEALDLYQSHVAGFVREALAQRSTRDAIEKLLEGAADRFLAPEQPTGCLVVLSGLSLDPIAQPSLAARLTDERQRFEGAIKSRLDAGLTAGDLPADADCAALARYVVMIYQALAIAARQGQSHSELRASARQATEGWPHRKGTPKPRPRRS